MRVCVCVCVATPAAIAALLFALVEIPAGFYVSLATLAPSIRWTVYVNPIHFTLMSYVLPFISDAEFNCASGCPTTTDTVSGRALLHPMGLVEEGMSLRYSWVGLVVWCVVLRLAALASLSRAVGKLRPKPMPVHSPYYM